MSDMLIGIISGIAVTVIGGWILHYIINNVKTKTITITKKQNIYISKSHCDSFSFNYSNNNGIYTIGSDDKVFTTKWSRASNERIYAYNDSSDIDSIGIIYNVGDITEILDIEVDFSSRSRTPKVGDAIIWRNINGYYAITKILSINDSTRNENEDCLECEYIIK